MPHRCAAQVVAGYRSTVSLVLVEHPRPEIAQITLNRPERMNSMAFDVMVPLKEALAQVSYELCGSEVSGSHACLNASG